MSSLRRGWFAVRSRLSSRPPESFLLDAWSDGFDAGRRFAAGSTAAISKPVLLDVVSLAEEVEGWPVGTVGTLVEAFEDGGIVEVGDEDSDDFAFLAVPYGALRREGNGSRSTERAGELGEDRQVSMKSDAIQPTNAER